MQIKMVSRAKAIAVGVAIMIVFLAGCSPQFNKGLPELTINTAPTSTVKPMTLTVSPTNVSIDPAGIMASTSIAHLTVFVDSPAYRGTIAFGLKKVSDGSSGTFTMMDGGSFVSQYAFQSSDHGSHSFQFTVNDPGIYQLVVTDLSDPTISAVSPAITVYLKDPDSFSPLTSNVHGVTGVSGNCIGPVDIGLVDADLNPTIALNGPLSFSLSTSNATGTIGSINYYSSLASCMAGGASTNTFTIAQNAASQSVYLQVSGVGTFELDIADANSAGTLAGAAHPPSSVAGAMALLKTAFNNPTAAPAGACVGPFTLSSTDGAGTASAVTQDTVFGISVYGLHNVGGVTLYGDSGCITPLDSTANCSGYNAGCVVILSGASISNSFYINAVAPAGGTESVDLQSYLLNDPAGAFAGGALAGSSTGPNTTYVFQ